MRDPSRGSALAIYRLTVNADRDIVDIYRYGVATFGVAQAEQYDAALHAAFELLSRQPHINRERLEFRRPVRVHRHRAHAIVYVRESDYVLIVRVLHGRQDWRRHL